MDPVEFVWCGAHDTYLLCEGELADIGLPGATVSGRVHRCPACGAEWMTKEETLRVEALADEAEERARMRDRSLPDSSEPLAPPWATVPPSPRRDGTRRS